MNKKTIVASALGALTSIFGFAQEQEEINAQVQDSIKVNPLEEVVVTDSRFELKRENSGKTVIKISQEEIRRHQGRTVADLINTKSGIEINGSRSNIGQPLGVYVRGGRNRQVLVIIDGVQVSDPSQIASDYDLRLLALDQIQSIEIIKGAASTLYGSGAATAVINITTKKANENSVNTVLSSSISTNQSKDNQDYNIANAINSTNNLNINGTLNKLTYKATFSQQYASGLSSAIGSEEDPFTKQAIDLNLGYAFSDAFSINVFGNLTDVDSHYDDGAFLDASNRFLSEQQRIGLSTAYKYTNGSAAINFAYSDYKREFISAFPSVVESENYVIDAFNKYKFNNRLHTIAGVNIINNKALFNEDETFTIVDPYINGVYVSSFGLNVNTGMRLNNHSEYGTHLTYNINPSFTLKLKENQYIKPFASYSSSYITPSLSQLFGFWGANGDLSPEENKTIEGGIEFKLNNNLRLSSLFFSREEKNTIIWEGSGYINAVDELNTRGVEVELNAKLIKKMSISANYTFLEQKENVPLLIPKHKTNLSANYNLCKKTFVSLSYQYTYDRLANDYSTWPATPVTLNTFSLVDFNASHTFNSDIVILSLGVENILNENYMDVFGFTSRGRNVRLGLKLNL